MRRAMLLGFLVFAGCQPHELDPVKPAGAKIAAPPELQIAQPYPADVIFVVDRSGSMSDAADGSAAGVCGQAGQQNQNCKWDELLTVLTGDQNPNKGFLREMQGAFSTSTDAMRMGLVTFSGAPGTTSDINEACSPGVLQVPVGANAADAVAAALEAIPPAGATPTSSSLEVAAQAFPANDPRPKLVVLLTDGAPNCNANVAIDQTTCGGDRCTMTCDTNGVATDARGCLDQSGLIAAIDDLHNQGISTFVIGFGADVTTGAAYLTLNEAAQHGGLAQSGTPSFYPASNDAELQHALQQVQGNPTCTYDLGGTPVSADTLEVQVTFCGQQPELVAASHFSLNGQLLSFTDQALCTQMQQASPACPTQVKFAYLAQ